MGSERELERYNLSGSDVHWLSLCHSLAAHVELYLIVCGSLGLDIMIAQGNGGCVLVVDDSCSRNVLGVDSHIVWDVNKRAAVDIVNIHCLTVKGNIPVALRQCYVVLRHPIV